MKVRLAPKVAGIERLFFFLVRLILRMSCSGLHRDRYSIYELLLSSSLDIRVSIQKRNVFTIDEYNKLRPIERQCLDFALKVNT